MLLTLSEIIGFVTFFFLLIFIIALFTIRRDNKLNNMLLALFLFVNLLFLLGFLTNALNDFFSVNILWFAIYGFFTGYLFGPTLYLFTKSITVPDFKVSSKDILHGIPFIIQIIFWVFLRNYWINSFLLLVNLHIIIYLVLCLKLQKNFEKRIREYYSSIERINLNWLKVVVYSFILMWLIDFIQLTTSIVFNSNVIDHYSILVSVSINFVFATLLFIQSLKHPEIISGVEKAQEKAKYEHSKLNNTKKEEYINLLESVCLEKKPYLSPNLTLDELSNITGIPSRHLSQIINENLNKNFYDFINEYRIEEAKRKLADPVSMKKTVLEIIYEVGFNSKSVFNTTFKKQTGLTPSEYKRKHIMA